jgi:cytochrome c peroxidase
VRDRQAAVRLGKALFWDAKVGSDGSTACASCHAHAGADDRA